MSEKILVIDDDPSLIELVRLILESRELFVYAANSGQEGLKMAYALQPDLIILDIMMPEQDGFETCTRLREITDVPILILSAKTQTSDITRGFATGADDYVKKPFSNEELLARIETLLRRKKTGAEKITSTNITGYADGFLDINLVENKLTLKGEELSLTPTEFKLLAFMIRHPHKTLSTQTLLTAVWGDAYNYNKTSLSLYIHQLRQKLKTEESEHKYIQTQWGQGYWFNPLPLTPKTAPDVESNESKRVSSASILFPTFRWLWLLLIIPILIFAMQTV